MHKSLIPDAESLPESPAECQAFVFAAHTAGVTLRAVDGGVTITGEELRLRDFFTRLGWESDDVDSVLAASIEASTGTFAGGIA